MRPVARVAFRFSGGLPCGWFEPYGTATLTLTHGSLINTVAFSPDGRTFAADDEDDTTKLFDEDLWNFADGFALRLVCEKVRRNMAQNEWEAYAPDLPPQKTWPRLSSSSLATMHTT